MKRYFWGLLLALSLGSFQAVADSEILAGKWYGHITMPEGEMLIITDFSYDDGGWAGTLDIPEQGGIGIPLYDFDVSDEQIAFSIQGLPGEPRFTGQQDGDLIRGTFSQGDNSMAFNLGREEISPPHVHTAEEAAAVIDGHLEAYNAHDLDAFVEWFHPDIEAFNFPDTKVFEGRDILRASFQQSFENKPHETVLKRIIDGNHVIDQVSVTFTIGGTEMTHEGTVIYTLEDHKIRRMTYMQ
ncbi:MAG: nuclear transport factor 2 family protein [Idiomarina sp.]|nr:nuclear transport factor 2 family protein [Idiomarina sp.]